MELVPLGALALVAGAVSFTSPCALPLLPGFASYVAGVEGADGDGRRVNRWGAWLFVAGFGLTFTALGATASAIGRLLQGGGRTLDVVGGAIVVAMGVVMVSGRRPGVLGREVRAPLHSIARGPAGALPLGVAFAFGWTPCIGPVLAGILTVAGRSGSVTQGAFLLGMYSVGLGIPFLLLARAVRAGTVRIAWLRRHGRTLDVAGGALLIAMGIALATGVWTRLMTVALSWYARFGWPPI